MCVHATHAGTREAKEVPHTLSVMEPLELLLGKHRVWMLHAGQTSRVESSVARMSATPLCYC